MSQRKIFNVLIKKTRH